MLCILLNYKQVAYNLNVAVGLGTFGMFNNYIIYGLGLFTSFHLAKHLQQTFYLKTKIHDATEISVVREIL